jgi:hypothetical protein
MIHDDANEVTSKQERKLQDWTIEVLTQLRARAQSDYAGVGLVVYEPPLRLPVINLRQAPHPSPLPTESVSAAVGLLTTISSKASQYHDGFHLVDGHRCAITHVSQFFAPPVSIEIPRDPWPRVGGARFMAAYLGSFLPHVFLCAVSTRDEGAYTFVRGEATRLWS